MNAESLSSAPRQQPAYDVFISYRRSKAAAEARLLRSALTERGVRVFMDLTDLTEGYFDEALLRNIASSSAFVLILSPGALDPCVDQNDWLRVEITRAIATGRKIVPVMLPGFEFPARLPDEIADIRRYHAVEYSNPFFDATVDKILEMAGQTSRSTDQRRVPAPADRKPRRRAFLIALTSAAFVALVSIAGYFLYAKLRTLSNESILQNESVPEIAKTLSQQFHAQEGGRPTSYTEIRREIDEIIRRDPSNGHGLYFSGEFMRVNNPSLFTPKSCVIREALAGYRGEFAVYQSDFYRYIRAAETYPANQTDGDAVVCYERVSGLCAERTAWINHLLANDLYEQALLSSNPQAKEDLLKRSKGFAEAARDLYQDRKGNAGFEQCTSTPELLSKIQSALLALDSGK